MLNGEIECGAVSAGLSKAEGGLVLVCSLFGETP
jgi:hypothetical protein